MPSGLLRFLGVAYADVRSSDIIAGLSVQDRGLAASSCPNIVAEHSIVVDENGTVYFERDADSQVQIASVTKTMTAIVALEYGDLQNTTIRLAKMLLQLASQPCQDFGPFCSSRTQRHRMHHRVHWDRPFLLGYPG